MLGRNSLKLIIQSVKLTLNHRNHATATGVTQATRVDPNYDKRFSLNKVFYITSFSLNKKMCEKLIFKGIFLLF
jgi:hypothetical protein